MRPRPEPPLPGLVRKPSSGFGWLDAALLHDRWLADLGADAIAVLVLLAIAADQYGASFFSRDKMAAALGFDRARVDRSLAALLDARLIAFRPWRPRHHDGVWQLLPVPVSEPAMRTRRTMPIAEILRSLGLGGAPNV